MKLTDRPLFWAALGLILAGWIVFVCEHAVGAEINLNLNLRIKTIDGKMVPGGSGPMTPNGVGGPMIPVHTGPPSTIPDASWTCIRSLASGTCGAATKQYFNAACDGVADDTPAFNSMVAAAQAGNPALFKLFIPSGSNCKQTTGQITNDVLNMTIWGYGACINNAGFGNFDGNLGLPHAEIFSGTYNSGNGAVSLSTTTQFALAPGQAFNLHGATADNSSALNGDHIATAGTTLGTINFTIATGLTITSIGGDGSQATWTGGGLIQSTNIGDNTVTLLNVADASKFTVGRWALVAGLETQAPGGYPPNFQFYEWRKVTNIAGAVISLGDVNLNPQPLTNQYLSTWPLWSGAGDGPAEIWPLSAFYETHVSVFGLSICDTQQVVISGYDMQFTDVSFQTMAGMMGIAPSMVYNGVFNNCYIGFAEIDKEDHILTFNNITGGDMLIQSASPDILNVNVANLQTQLFGTPKVANITGLTTPLIAIGPNGFGVSTSVAISNSTFSSQRASGEFIATSSLSFSAGTFSVPLANPASGTVAQMFVPGHTYFRGDSPSYTASSPPLVFHATGLRQDAVNVYIDTDIGATLPSCTSNCGEYITLPANVITQTNTGASPDITYLASPP